MTFQTGSEELAKAWPDAFLPVLANSRGINGAILRSMGRHSEAVDSYAQGIREITPCFQKVPSAYADLTSCLYNDYITAIQQAEVQPDKDLLEPILELFDKLKQSKPNE